MARPNRTWRSGVYAIVNMHNGKAYVGSAALIAKRWSEHRNALRRGCHVSPHLQAAWQTYGAEAFEWRVLEYAPAESLLDREQWWADHLRSYERAHGYNVRRTVGSSLGVRLSRETRAKMSAAHQGQRQTPEHAARQCAARRGRRNTVEQRRMMGAANRRVPEETVREVRILLASGLPQVQIAQMCGVSQQFVSKIKRGRLLWVTLLNEDGGASPTTPLPGATARGSRGEAV